MSCHTENDDYVKRYEKFASEIEPECSKMGNKVDIFITTHSCFSQLSADRFSQLIKIFNRDLELFRDENVPLNATLSKLSSKYDQIAGGLTKIDGEDLPMPIAGTRLLSENREIRKEAWLAMQESRFAKKDEFDTIYNKMIKLRHKWQQMQDMIIIVIFNMITYNALIIHLQMQRLFIML